MKISEIGQFGMIDIVAKMIEQSRDDQSPSWQNLITGIGDDCAVWHSEPLPCLAKVDCQVQGIHFNLDILSWEDLGWKSLAVNLSDIAAMGGSPRYALVSLGLPLQTEVEEVVSLYSGLLELARKTGTAIVGGNMSSSPMIFVDVNVIGTTGNPAGKYLTRSGAQPGDLIAVTGWLGTAAGGLAMLTRRLEFSESISTCLKRAFCRPEPRLAEGILFQNKGVTTAIDISDGLVADLKHICDASHVGAVVQIERLPVKDELRTAFGAEALIMALSGGEDYQLLFTASPEIIDRIKQETIYPITVIGEIVSENPGEVILINQEGKRFQPERTGWDHFSRARF